mgnify:CR=1 FL=1
MVKQHQYNKDLVKNSRTRISYLSNDCHLDDDASPLVA